MHTANTSRNHYFDFLRGIAILMVIAIHTTPASLSFSSTTGCVWICVRQLFNAAVPLFLAISAFFLGKKSLDTWNERTTFWCRQIPKIYIPCLLWSLPLWGTAIVRGGDIINETARLLLCGFSIYYFIALIIQYYLLLPWLRPFGRKQIVISTSITAIAILLVSYVTAIKGIALPLMAYAAIFPVWMLFFVMGGALAYSKRNYPLILPALLCIGGLVLSFFEAKYLYTFHGVGIGIKLSAFIYAAGIILLLFSQKLEQAFSPHNKACQIVTYIGRISFGIYFTHCHFIPFAKRLLPFDSWIATWLLVALFSIVAIASCRKLFPDKILSYIGFK